MAGHTVTEPVGQKRHENPEIAAAIERMLRAIGDRIAASDPYDLELITDVQYAVDRAATAAVRGLRQRGYSWQDIGDGLGVTRQAAQQRWGRPDGC